MTQCPACKAIQDTGSSYLGRLGILHWFRCRFCGMEWNSTIDPLEWAE